MQNKHELWKFLLVTRPANMGAKTGDFWQGRIQRQEQRLEKTWRQSLLRQCQARQ